jgi:hypothetical protein
MKKKPAPPYDENEQVILDTACQMIEAMRQLKNGVEQNDPGLIQQGIRGVTFQLRSYRFLTRSISQEVKSIEGKEPVHLTDLDLS